MGLSDFPVFEPAVDPTCLRFYCSPGTVWWQYKLLTLIFTDSNWWNASNIKESIFTLWTTAASALWQDNNDKAMDKSHYIWDKQKYLASFQLMEITRSTLVLCCGICGIPFCLYFSFFFIFLKPKMLSQTKLSQELCKCKHFSTDLRILCTHFHQNEVPRRTWVLKTTLQQQTKECIHSAGKKKLWRMVCYSTKHFTKSFIIVFNVLCFLVSRYLHSDLKIITKSSNIYSRLLKYLHLNYGTPTMINTALCGHCHKWRNSRGSFPPRCNYTCLCTWPHLKTLHIFLSFLPPKHLWVHHMIPTKLCNYFILWINKDSEQTFCLFRFVFFNIHHYFIASISHIIWIMSVLQRSYVTPMRSSLIVG